MSLVDKIIEFTTVLSPSPVGRAGFGFPLVLVDLATNSLNGETTRFYASTQETQADVTAGYISATTKARVDIMFQQNPSPNGVRVGAVDIGGSEAYGAAFTRINGVVNDFYPVIPLSRTAADIVSLSAAVEAAATRKQMMAQVSDADWLTASNPAAYDTIVSNLRTSLVFHDTDTRLGVEGWVGNRIAFDPDDRSVDWKTNIVGIAPYTTGLTSAQRNALEGNNVNAIEEFAAAANWLYDGKSIAGNPVKTVFSADWYTIRAQEDIADLFVRTAAFGDIIEVGDDGQDQIVALLEARLAHGVRVKHFKAGETRVIPQPISQTDLDTQTLRFTVEAQEARSANRIRLNYFLTNSPLEEL